MADQLTTSTGASSGVQSTTQSPQSAGQPASVGTQASGVQPGTASTLLNSQGGLPLHGTALSTVNLNATSGVTAAPTSSPAKHHTNPVLFGLSALFLVAAVVLFWAVGHSVKNTTQY
jgi:hypothetical protein